MAHGSAMQRPPVALTDSAGAESKQLIYNVDFQ